MLRTIPPAWSPVFGSTVMAGLASVVQGSSRAYGPLRDLLREQLSTREVLLTDSGTSALTLALRIAKDRVPDAPIALPAWSCYDLATAAVGAGVKVRFYDLDPETLEPDLDSLHAALAGDQGARTVVVAHLFGYPADLAAVQTLADRFDALVIEDSAQALGAVREGRRCGTQGHMSVLSFGRGKGVTGGRGGALLLHAPGLAEHFGAASQALGRVPWGLPELALVFALWVFASPTLYAIPAGLPFLYLGESVYRDPHPPRALSRTAAAAIVATLPFLEREIQIRRRHAEELFGRLRAHPWVCPVKPAMGFVEPTYLRLPVLLSGWDPTAVLRSGRRLGVASGYPKTLAEIPALERSILGGCSLVGARRLAGSLITLPTHSRLTALDRERLEAWLAFRNGPGAA